MNKIEAPTIKTQIPIYVISLARSVERRAFMQSQLPHLGLQFQFVDAVDGKALDSELASKIEQQRDTQLYTKPFTKGEIGCMCSHMNIYEIMSSQNKECALLLEDDVFLSKQLTSFLDASTIAKLPIDWDIILLAYVQRGNIESMPKKRAIISFWNRIRLPNDFLIGKPVQFCYHAAAYMVSKQGAEKLQSVGKPLRMPADILTGNSHIWGLNLYTVSKPLVWQHEEVASQSTIKELNADSAQKSSYSTLLAGNANKGMQWYKRVLSYLWNKTIMCAKGHTFPVVFLRQLGLIPPDQI